jgi:hypothetical protein
MDSKALARFQSKVQKDEKTGCLVWTGAKTFNGYGTFYINGKMCRAHRVIWEHENGPIPDGRNVLHDCPCGDNPACVNIDHLWLGTQSDNINDMIIKDRRDHTVDSEVCLSLEDILS